MKKIRLLMPTLTLVVTALATPSLVSCGNKTGVFDGSTNLNAYYGDSGHDSSPWKFKLDEIETKPDKWEISTAGLHPAPVDKVKIDENGYVYWESKEGDYIDVGKYTFKVVATMSGKKYSSPIITLTINAIEEDMVTGGSTQLEIDCDESGKDLYRWSAKKADGSIVTDAKLSLEVVEPTTSIDGITIENGYIKWIDTIPAGVYYFRIKATAKDYEVYSDTITYKFNETSKVLTVEDGTTSLTGYQGFNGSDSKTWKVKLDGNEVKGAILTIESTTSTPLPKNIVIENGCVAWKAIKDGDKLQPGEYDFIVKAKYKTKIAKSSPIKLTVNEVKGYIVYGGAYELFGRQASAGADEKPWKVYDAYGEITADLSIDPVEDSSIEGIYLDNGIVKWNINMEAGTYKFRIKATIPNEEAAYSEKITLDIQETQFKFATSRTDYLYATNQGYEDEMQWTTTLDDQVVTPTFELLPGGSSSSVPKGLSITQDGYVKWTNELAYGTYYFKVKATYQDVYSKTSDDIKLELIQPTSADNFEWDVNDSNGTATILKKKDGVKLSSIVLPTFYNHNGKDFLVDSIGYECLKEESDGPNYLSNLTIPDNIQNLNEYGLWCCKKLTSIRLPYHIESGGDNFLMNCTKLEHITIPSTWTYIPFSFFDLCKSLKMSTLPETITEIGESAFRCCYALTSFTIPSSVTKIPEYCFGQCNITELKFGKNITEISYDAVCSCGQLTSIIFDGTLEDYKKINRDRSWHSGTPSNACIYFNDGSSVRLEEIDPIEP